MLLNKINIKYLTETLLPWNPCERDDDDENMIYSINNLKDTKARPSNKDPIYSAFRGPNSDSFFAKTYKGRELFNEYYGKYKSYNPDEPLYLYHGPRLCVEKTTDDENKTLIADSLFRPKRKYFDPDDLLSLLDENLIKSNMSNLMANRVYKVKEEYERFCKDPKFLYLSSEN